jgi:DNA-binding SARP family transcriptional activator
MERRLRRGGGKDTLRAIDQSLKLFRQACIEMGTKVPVVQGIEARTDQIELVLDRPMDSEAVPRPFEIRSGRSSVFIAKEEIPSIPTGSHNPFPTLVAIGDGPEGPQLINLEATGSLAVVGDPKDCEDVIRALALEMATSYWAGQFDLVLVGFGNELARFDRVLSSSNLGMVLHQVRYRRLNGEALLRASSYESFSHARVFEDLDTWDPLIVVCGPGLRSEACAELMSAASDPRNGMATIAPGPGIPTSQIWSVSGTRRSFSTDIFSSPATPQSITPTELADIGGLVDTARDYESADLGASPYSAMSIPMPAQPFEVSPRIHSHTTHSEPNGGRSEVDHGGAVGSATGTKAIEVEVSVLGPVEIDGAEHEFTRAWAKDLVVYLAMHPNGVSNDAWATALWPDRLMASSSLHSTASVARRSLGHDREGQDHLPKAHGRLRLAESVSTDWDRFVGLADGDSAVDWKEALELVRGRLFDGLRSPDWPILEGIAPAMEATIVDVAGRLAGAYLQQDNAGGAEWAARKGLQVSPYDERMYRMLLRAADTAGNPAGVESVMSELVRLVADEVEPFDSVHPSTVELYQSLSRRKSLATSQR